MQLGFDIVSVGYDDLTKYSPMFNENENLSIHIRTPAKLIIKSLLSVLRWSMHLLHLCITKVNSKH